MKNKSHEDKTALINILESCFKISIVDNKDFILDKDSINFITVDIYDNLLDIFQEDLLFEILDDLADTSQKISDLLFSNEKLSKEIKSAVIAGKPYDFSKANELYLKLLEEIKREKGIDFKNILLKKWGIENE